MNLTPPDTTLSVVHQTLIALDRLWDADINTPKIILHLHNVATFTPVAYPGILFWGGGSTNSVEDRGQRERGSGGGSPLVRGSGGGCNLVQEISFHIVNFS
jgi:hypothetical protein